MVEKVRRLFYVPIEPLEERYSADWFTWFPEVFKNFGFEVSIVAGMSLTDKIITGSFLDTNSTFHYKAHQLANIAKLFFEKQVRSGDVFFVGDIEFPGIESIRYISEMQGIHVGMYGVCHAASYTRYDMMEQMAWFAQYTERGWFRCFDGIFVGSGYHKEQIKALRHPTARILASGNPVDVIKLAAFRLPFKQKKNKIILANRLDNGKDPIAQLQYTYECKKKDPSLEIVVTTSSSTFRSDTPMILAMYRDAEKANVLILKSDLTKEEYYEELAESKIFLSTSLEENFGYIIAEAIGVGTLPLVTNGYSHRELVPLGSLRFDTAAEAIGKLQDYLQLTEKDYFRLADTLRKNPFYQSLDYEDCIGHMAQLMLMEMRGK